MVSRLYTILFEDGTAIEELGYGEQDLRNFCDRCHNGRVIKSITLID